MLEENLTPEEFEEFKDLQENYKGSAEFWTETQEEAEEQSEIHRKLVELKRKAMLNKK